MQRDLKMEAAVDKKDQLLDAAELLFANHGFEGVSIRKLADQVGMNSAMISYYFGSKEKLYKAVIERRLTNIQKSVPVLLDNSLTRFERMFALTDFYVERFFTTRAFQQIMFREMSLNNRSRYSRQISERWYENFKTVSEFIHDGIRKKEFRKVDVELTMVSIVGTVKMFINSPMVAQRCTGEETLDNVFSDKYRKRMKAHLRDMIVKHLTP